MKYIYERSKHAQFDCIEFFCRRIRKLYVQSLFDSYVRLIVIRICSEFFLPSLNTYFMFSIEALRKST